jgi:p-hydroxybenzoate 3-monooxygenase
MMLTSLRREALEPAHVRTQVGIIGAGPAGLVLSHLLHQKARCDFVIGADGFHGVSRGYVPDLVTYERTYPFAWLGILAEAAPSSHELIYARHTNGFALHSMCSPSLTRMYL